MKTIRTTVMAFAALAVMVGRAGESAEFRLDTMDGPRTARAVETIAYSTAWNNGDSVSVALDGVAVKEANAPASGDVVWNAAQATPGTHTLTHTCGSETLTAVFEVVQAPLPLPTLSVETADWTDGTITLRCEDADLNGADAPFYNLMYYDTSEAKWRVIDRYDLTIPTPVEETNGNGGKSIVTRITDKYFSKRNNGVGTVKYRVVDEADAGRMAGCETRKRYGLFVAVGEYADTKLSPLPMVKHECAVFKDAYVRYGGGGGLCWSADSKPTKFEVLSLLSAMKEKVMPGDIFLFYFYGHGGTGYLCCYDKDGKITNSDLKEYFKDFCDGAGMVAVIYCCHSASMFLQDNDSMNLGRVGWILSSQADELTWAYSVTSIICNDGWFNGKADVLNGEYGFGNGDGYVTFAELAEYGLDWTIKNEYYGHRQQMKPANTFILSNIVAGKIPSSNTSDRKWKWLTRFASLFSSANGDVVAAETMPAANGCRTVGECYALGINPEDPNDDLKIADFKMEGGKPVITLNHTEDGSGNSFLPRVKTLGKADLSDATEEWRVVPGEGDQTMRFFKVEVEMP